MKKIIFFVLLFSTKVCMSMQEMNSSSATLNSQRTICPEIRIDMTMLNEQKTNNHIFKPSQPNIDQLLENQTQLLKKIESMDTRQKILESNTLSQRNFKLYIGLSVIGSLASTASLFLSSFYKP